MIRVRFEPRFESGGGFEADGGGPMEFRAHGRFLISI